MSFLVQKRTYISCYFLVILWPFKSAYCEKKVPQNLQYNNNPVTQINSAKSPVFWPVKSKIYYVKSYALKVIKVSDQIEIEHLVRGNGARLQKCSNYPTHNFYL